MVAEREVNTQFGPGLSILTALVEMIERLRRVADLLEMRGRDRASVEVGGIHPGECNAGPSQLGN